MLEKAFWERVRRLSNNCWLWTGSVTPDGYPRFHVGGHRMVAAHRWAYEHWVGPIPAGLVLEHLEDICGLRLCVNPKHLHPVPWRGRRTKTYCVAGHAVAEVGRTAGGACRECNREIQKRWRQRKIAADPEYLARRAADQRAWRAAQKSPKSAEQVGAE